MSLLSYIAESNKLWIAKIELELKKIYTYSSICAQKWENQNRALLEIYK